MTKKQKWYTSWFVWWLSIVVSFAIIEGLAIEYNGVTLSRTVWDLTLAWPPIPFVFGVVVGGLAVHFWWHWNPPGSKSQG